MRYLGYWFNKPTLPSPPEPLEILYFVVLTLIWYHNIRRGARGDRFFGSRSIAAIFPLENEHSFFFPFSGRRALNWDYGTISWSSHAFQQPCIMDFQLYYLFAWHYSNDSELSCRGESHVPVWCQFTDDRRRFYFGLEHWLRVFEMMNPMKLKSVDFIAK